jgi:transcriptional regulator with XRE-family HTH domain
MNRTNFQEDNHMTRRRNESIIKIDDLEGMETRTPTQQLLLDAFVIWQDRQRKKGYRQTYDQQFAHYLDVSASSLSKWLNGGIVSLPNCIKLSKHLGKTIDGKDIYQVNGFDPVYMIDSPELRFVIEVWHKVPDATQRQILDHLHEEYENVHDITKEPSKAR